MKPSTMTSAIEDNSRQCERELRQAEQRLSEAHDVTLKLEHRILEGLREVAAVQLDNPDSYSRDVILELDQRRNEESKLRSDLEGVELSIGTLNGMATELSRRVETLTLDVNRALAVDPSYIKLLHELDAARLADADYKVHEVDIAAECTRKLKVYQESTVFIYLWRAEYGTENYKGRFLIRALDGWLASRTMFRENASSYRMLMAMQRANDSRQAELAHAAEVAAEVVKSCAKRAYAAAGLGNAQASLKSIKEKISKHKHEANFFHTALGKYALRKDDRSRKAESLILNSLRTKTFDEIQSLVRASTASGDDQAAAHVSILQRELAAQHQSVPQLEQIRLQAQTKYDRAKKLEREMRQLRYTHPDVRYSNDLNMDMLVLGYMAGSLDILSVQNEVVRSQLEIPAYVPVVVADDVDDRRTGSRMSDLGSGAIFGGDIFTGGGGGDDSFVTTSNDAGTFSTTGDF